MNRKSLLACLAVLAAMAVAVAVAVAVLYHDSEKVKRPVESRYELLQAVPSNAVVAGCVAQMKNIYGSAFEGFDFFADLSDKASDGLFGTLSESPVAFSLHYSGKLTPLYIFDAEVSDPALSVYVDELLRFGQERGLKTTYLEDRSLVLMAETETLIKSSQRHMEQSLSVVEAPGFRKASESVEGDNLLFVSYSHARPLFSSLLSRKYSSFAAFAGTMAEWAAFEIGSSDAAPCILEGRQIFDDDASEFMSVLGNSPESQSALSEVLPSYTCHALSLPMSSVEDYVAAYRGYLDSRQMLSEYNFRQNELRKKYKLHPDELMKRLGVREIARAAFGTSGEMSEVVLVRLARRDSMLLSGASELLPAVFGEFFGLDDMSSATYIDDWLVAGSRKAVDEYDSGRALEYTLGQYMRDAGSSDMLALMKCSLMAYSNLGLDSGFLSGLLKDEVYEAVKPLYEGAEYAPMVLYAYEKGGCVATDIVVHNLSLQRMKAPEFERDTVVTVPSGPFKVKNSGTGRTNIFYQNPQGAICLKEEDGTGIWGVPFGKPLCGRASTVDYYDNGKLQIIFGAEDKIYLIDRLGRFVTGFPLSLGKPILLGPDVYDFNGSRAYNIMVLHKDNTIEMYNLKGRKPASWKGITADETIKGLPERLEVGGKTFWIVRTSIQTLIFPFEGGNPLTVFEGQKMILPSSEITVVDDTSVKAECYDGKAVTIKVK